MFYGKYPDLISAYLDVNSRLWGKLGTIEMGCDLVPPPMVLEIECSKWDLGTIPLKKLGYSENKINLLIKNYHDPLGWENFYPNPTKRRLGIKVKKRDVTYYFKRKTRGENCLILISYHRVTNQYTVVWRTTELGARWGADLIWLSRLLPGEKLVLVIPYSYQSSQVWVGISEMLGVSPEISNDKRRIWDWAMRYYPPELDLSNLSTWSPVRVVQKKLIEWRNHK